jgi:hypothetical protein
LIGASFKRKLSTKKPFDYSETLNRLPVTFAVSRIVSARELRFWRVIRVLNLKVKPNLHNEILEREKGKYRVFGSK